MNNNKEINELLKSYNTKETLKELKKELKKINSNFKKGKVNKLYYKGKVSGIKNRIKALEKYKDKYIFNVGGKVYKVKKSYFDKIKDKERYLTGLLFRSLERKVQTTSEQFEFYKKIAKILNKPLKYNKKYDLLDYGEIALVEIGENEENDSDLYDILVVVNNGVISLIFI